MDEKAVNEDATAIQKKPIRFQIGICCLYHVLSWGLFSLEDYLWEYVDSGDYFFSFWGMPIIACILYFYFRKRIFRLQSITWKGNAVFFLIWFVVSLVFGFVITLMTCEYNNWIVRQHTGGWEYFLNGIEYPLFGILLGAGPLIVAILGEIAIRIGCALSKK